MRTRLVDNNETKPLWETVNEVVDCPICKGENTLMVETTIERQPTDPPSEQMHENYVEHYLCMRCGYTTTSDMVVGGEMAQLASKKSPKLVNDLSVADNIRNLAWFPSVINLSPKGICYPDGTPTDWGWVVAPYAPLSESERTTYLSGEEESDRFKFRLAVEKSMKFDKYDFQNALAFLGALVERNKDA